MFVHVVIPFISHAYSKEKGRVFNVLSYGNNIHDINRGVGTIHAEVNAINNLKPLPRQKHKKSINLLVIRTSKTGKLGESKPCIKCVYDISTLPQKKGYIIKTISYSNSEGIIIDTSPSKMIAEGDFHYTRFYKDRNYSSPLIK